MRKQYHSRQVGADILIWDVHRLVRQSKKHPIVQVPLTALSELDELWWYQEPDDLPTPRSIAAHMALVQSIDLSYPIILCEAGRLMDGMHRLTRALLEGHQTISAVRFAETPQPDFKNVSLADLPYPDEDV